MVRGLERFAPALLLRGLNEDFFVHLQIGLELQGVTGIPLLLARQRREEFLAKGRSVLARCSDQSLLHRNQDADRRQGRPLRGFAGQSRQPWNLLFTTD